MNIQALLSERINNALIAVGIPINNKTYKYYITKSQFGDYQINGIIQIAKIIGMHPYRLAERILPLLKLDKITSKMQIAGSGFINIIFDEKWLAQQIDINVKYKNIFFSTSIKPQTIVVDYSGPNIAKEMHVGHLRSTIIGDAVARTLEFIGHKVIRVNHIGDWGTQFGVLIAYLDIIKKKYKSNISLGHLEKYYCEAQKQYKTDVGFAQLARNYVVKLQSGDKYCYNIWRKLVNITINKNQNIYNRLNISLKKKDIKGESFYKNMLPDIIHDLIKKKIAIENDGAIIVYLQEFKNKDNKPIGIIVQKKDGGYLYTTTDIACIKYRYETLHADRILYFIDSRQNQHLMQVWNIARKANYIPKSIILEHNMIGMMLGENGKPIKTRTGDNIKLSDLLDEAIKRAYNLIKKKKSNIKNNELTSIINAIGIGAIKYADLSKNRTINYIFDWNKILTLNGNTAPYIQYAYTRIMSILNNKEIQKIKLCSPVIIVNIYERKLAVQLLQFEETILTVAHKSSPHFLCQYLYNLAVLFSNFYENCPILYADNQYLKESRLKIIFLTKKILKTGLNILGITTVEKM